MNESELASELRTWLNGQSITSDNIGNIRRLLMMPWDSEWNAIVRDETARREQANPTPQQTATP